VNFDLPRVEKSYHGLDNENINKFKRTFRSGLQVDAPDNLTGNEQLMLMEIRNPELIKAGNIFGDSNGSNGKNGWERNELYYAHYLSSEGVGRKPKPT
jgi:hypothetical protein